MASFRPADKLVPELVLQELDINPRTLNPEQVLKLGRIERIDGSTYVVSRLTRPGFTHVAFGGGVEEEEQEEEVGEELTIGLDAMISANWQVVG